MTTPPTPPGVPRPSAALLSLLAALGAGVWLVAFVNAGVAAFIAAVVALAAGLLVGVAVMHAVADDLHQRRTSAAQEYATALHERAGQALAGQHETALALRLAEGKLRHAEDDNLRLRAQLDAVEEKEGTPQ